VARLINGGTVSISQRRTGNTGTTRKSQNKIRIQIKIMSFRTFIANKIIGFGRRIGRSNSSELKVTLSDHSIDVRMVDTDIDELYWDDNLYKFGNVFPAGYSNPIKVSVDHKPEISKPDTVEVEESKPDTEPDSKEGGEGEEDSAHVSVMSTKRYKMFMKQTLASDLLNPKEQLDKLMYAIIGVAVLQFVTMVLLAFTSGAI
jgi:hypothetical protein